MKRKKFSRNLIRIGFVLLFGLVLSCEKEEIAELGQDNIDSEEGVITLKSACSTITYTYPNDVNNSVNATIDDRCCDFDYAQTTNGTSYTWGSYRLSSGSSSDSNQPRIERASQVVSNVNGGNYIQISGVVRIKKAGSGDSESTNDSMTNTNGTYFIQAKGKHSGGGGSADPAIALFLAKPKTINGVEYFDIYREQINYRGGSGSDGRTLVYLTRVKANRDFSLTVKTGFWENPLRHYITATINGQNYYFNVPEPEKSLQAKLRMGAYRCKGGSAEILWRSGLTTTFKNN